MLVLNTFNSDNSKELSELIPRYKILDQKQNEKSQNKIYVLSNGSIECTHYFNAQSGNVTVNVNV